VEVIKTSVHTGSTGKLHLKKIGQELRKEMLWWKKKQKIFDLAINKLIKPINQCPTPSCHLQSQF